MANNEGTPKGGLWARLFGVSQSEPEEKAAEELTPEIDEAPAPPAPVVEAPPAAAPAAESNGLKPALQTPPPAPLTLPPQGRERVEVLAATPAAPVLEATPAAPVLDLEPPPAVVAEALPETCPSCGSLRKGTSTFCDDCGWMFAASKPAARVSSPRATMLQAAAVRIKDRYEVGQLINERAGICRYRGIDHGAGGLPVTIVWAPLPEMAEPILDELPLAAIEESEVMPAFEEAVPVANFAAAGSDWPGLAWERAVLDKAQHPALPKFVDSFVENNFEYLILEAPEGRGLWDAWDDPDNTGDTRYGWLRQLAEGLHALYQAGAIIEGFRPDLVTVTADGQAMIGDLSDLLPLPLPPSPPLRATLYTAPELILTPDQTDGRATLYGFGALMYSLEYLHHPLEEKDFESPYTPRQITDRFPDVHPLFMRLINKTFVRDPNCRFPSDEMLKTDPSGLTELARTLDICRRAFDQVRLDIAAWTTTGMVRTGNEDALTVLHGVDTRQDDVREYALVLLADGMGGYEAGEVAADLALNTLRHYLLQQPVFAPLTGGKAPDGPLDVEALKNLLKEALRHANKEVFTFGRTPGKGKRGMGCTAEAVYIDSRNLVVGHVGDSRTYHLHQGRLIQLTRDQTLVNRLVELGQLTPEEAEDHPRKNELQQAIGGQPDVAPGTYSGRLKRGDWVLVCTDGLTNHIPSPDLEKMLTREAAYSAEEAARRLMNLVNLRGATDNATIVVVRAC